VSDTAISTILAAELDAVRTETRESLLLSNDNEQYIAEETIYVSVELNQKKAKIVVLLLSTS